jgi:hypothetical protein
MFPEKDDTEEVRTSQPAPIVFIRKPPLPSEDVRVLRELAERVRLLADRPIEKEKERLWREHNALMPTRPVVFCDPENGWNEIIPPDDLSCRENLAREWEYALRKEIFWGQRMRDDRVITGIFEVSHVYTETDMGVPITFHRKDAAGSYVWDAPIREPEDLQKLKFPKIEINKSATDERLELAHEVFGGILRVRRKTVWWWTLGLTMSLAYLRGMERMMMDMIDAPEMVHQLMGFLRDSQLKRLDFLEKERLLHTNTDGTYVGSGGFGWTDEIREKGEDGMVRPENMWGFAESQETVGISPAMFEEFVLPYQLPLLEKFGLNCYGCCEPLDSRWKHVTKIPRLRRVSVSPWADVRKMADNLQDKYIFSWKPNPSDLARSHFDTDHIRRNIRETFQITKGCRVEIIMKDCHTIANSPDRVVDWTRIAKEEAERAAEGG